MKNILMIGATSTIAQDISKIYASEGLRIILVGRNASMLEIIKNDLIVRGAYEVKTIPFNLSEVESIDSLVEQIISVVKKIDIAILCHGDLGEQSHLAANVKSFLEIVATNYTSHAILSLKLSTLMKNTGGGSLAVLSSVAGERGKKSNFIYGSTMSAKTIFTEGLRHQMHGSCVSITTIMLGFVDTKMTAQFKKGPLWATSTSVAHKIVKAIQYRKDSVYIPGYWRWIMFIIKSIPEFIFKHLNL